jgi:hypothetical protein
MASRLHVEIAQENVEIARGHLDERFRSTELSLRVSNCDLDYKSRTCGIF